MTRKKKKRLDDEMVRLFQGTGIQPLPSSPSYFMWQDEEGRLELLGSRAMYKNLAQAGELDADTNVVGSLGIGRGSSQWMVLKANGETELVGHKAGMSNVEKLALLGETIMGTYAKDEAKLNTFLEVMESAKKPLIALKSGCTIVFDLTKEYPNLKAQIKAGEEKKEEPPATAPAAGPAATPAQAGSAKPAAGAGAGETKADATKAGATPQPAKQRRLCSLL